jgi:hypothetical protein
MNSCHGPVALAMAVAAMAAVSQPSEACLRIGPVSQSAMIAGATLIVRATAVEYAVPAEGARFRQGFRAGTVRFAVLETLKGANPIDEVVLPGVLTERDDFNDHAPPYTFVRPEGRGGDCFASAYRRGAQFLLFLGRSHSAVHLYPEPLGPVNEQLHGDNDPWLVWVRAAQARPAGPPNMRVKPGA